MEGYSAPPGSVPAGSLSAGHLPKPAAVAHRISPHTGQYAGQTKLQSESGEWMTSRITPHSSQRVRLVACCSSTRGSHALRGWSFLLAAVPSAAHVRQLRYLPFGSRIVFARTVTRRVLPTPSVIKG